MSHVMQPDILLSAGSRLTLLNPLYVLPVTAVLILCLLVYAFGFKSTTPLPPSLHSLSQKDSKKLSSGKKRNEKLSKSISKSSAAPAASHESAVKSKPKAVVKPMRQENRIKKQKETPVTKAEKNSLIHKQVVYEEDEGLGDWVPVLSDKTKKKAQKQKQESAITVTEAVDDGPIPSDQPVLPDQQNEVIQKVVVEVTELRDDGLGVEDWNVEDPIQEKETRTKKKNKRVKESQMRQQSSLAPPPSDSSSTSESKVVKDKLTSEILATYDSVPESEKSTSRKRKEKREKRIKGQEPQQHPVLSAVVTQESLTHEKAADVVTAVVPVTTETATASSDNADVTDATGSDPSDGEFKVVRKRKARRE